MPRHLGSAFALRHRGSYRRGGRLNNWGPSSLYSRRLYCDTEEASRTRKRSLQQNRWRSYRPGGRPDIWGPLSPIQSAVVLRHKGSFALAKKVAAAEPESKDKKEKEKEEDGPTLNHTTSTLTPGKND